MLPKLQVIICSTRPGRVGPAVAQAVKLQLTTLKMMPMMEGVMIPMVSKHVDDSGTFTSNESIDKSAPTLLDELQRWAVGLKAMRDSMSSE